jgi:GntR family transcriptional regulator
MFVTVDPHDPLPIYEQIVRRLKFAIAQGAVLPGEHIPSVRELARELAINPNTVARAYRELQAEGLVVSRRGTGLAVAAGAPARCRPERTELIRVRLRQLLDEARQGGITAAELRKLIDLELRAYRPRQVQT